VLYDGYRHGHRPVGPITPAIGNRTQPIRPTAAGCVSKSDRSGRSSFTSARVRRRGDADPRFARGALWNAGLVAARPILCLLPSKNKGRFTIGCDDVWRVPQERLLTASSWMKGPSVGRQTDGSIMFCARNPKGAGGEVVAVFRSDISGRNLKAVRPKRAGSDPSWSPLQKVNK